MPSFRIALRIKHPSADPAFVAARLGMKPKMSWMAGMPRLSPTGRAVGIAEESFCTFELDAPKEALLADVLAFHANQLMDHKLFLQELRNSGGSVEFYVGWFIDHHAGDIFEVDLLGRLGLLGISLAIEVYGPDEKSFTPEILEFKRTQ